jgi:hypothetical protein
VKRNKAILVTFFIVIVCALCVGLGSALVGASSNEAPIPVRTTETYNYYEHTEPTPTSSEESAEGAEQSDEEQESVYYKNCTEARKAGAAPLQRGDPGYRKELDRDNNGEACV